MAVIEWGFFGKADCQGVHGMWFMHACVERLAGLLHASASFKTLFSHFLHGQLLYIDHAFFNAFDLSINRRHNMKLLTAETHSYTFSLETIEQRAIDVSRVCCAVEKQVATTCSVQHALSLEMKLIRKS